MSKPKVSKWYNADKLLPNLGVLAVFKMKGDDDYSYRIGEAYYDEEEHEICVEEYDNYDVTMIGKWSEVEKWCYFDAR